MARPEWMRPADPEERARRETHDRFRRLIRNLRLGNTPAECERLRAENERLRRQVEGEG